jgi:hypothetical protein
MATEAHGKITDVLLTPSPTRDADRDVDGRAKQGAVAERVGVRGVNQIIA